MSNVNIYKREQLYKEVWENPVTEVAKKYGVSDVMIHKACKSLDIPTPPRGYWVKISYGKPIIKASLPQSDMIQKVGRRFEYKIDKDLINILNFLSEDELEQISLITKNIEIPNNNCLHKKVLKHKYIVDEWNKKDTRRKLAERIPSDFKIKGEYPPSLVGVVSKELLPRAYKVLSMLFINLETLGCVINDDLSIQVRNETVRLRVNELQDKIDHPLTKKEELEFKEYEDKIKNNYRWVSKPQISKYDYIFNGRLSISTKEKKYFRDKKM